MTKTLLICKVKYLDMHCASPATYEYYEGTSLKRRNITLLTQVMAAGSSATSLPVSAHKWNPQMQGPVGAPTGCTFDRKDTFSTYSIYRSKASSFEFPQTRNWEARAGAPQDSHARGNRVRSFFQSFPIWM